MAINLIYSNQLSHCSHFLPINHPRPSYHHHPTQPPSHPLYLHLVYRHCHPHHHHDTYHRRRPNRLHRTLTRRRRRLRRGDVGNKVQGEELEVLWGGK